MMCQGGGTYTPISTGLLARLSNILITTSNYFTNGNEMNVDDPTYIQINMLVIL